MDTLDCLAPCAPLPAPVTLPWYAPACRCRITGRLLWPRTTALVPDEAVLGDADLTLHVMGAHFTPESVILFNGGVEPTTFVSDTELTTIVKPSTAVVAIDVPVQVRTGSRTSAPRYFSFLQEAPPPAATAPPTGWDDPIFAGVTETTFLPQFNTFANIDGLSIVSDPSNGDAALNLAAGAVVRRVRIDAREGIRIGGPGNYLFEDCFVTVESGAVDDHADAVQVYAPGAAPTVTFRRCYLKLTNAAGFGNNACVAFSDNARATIAIEDCVFDGTGAPTHGALWLTNADPVTDISVVSITATNLTMFAGWDFVGTNWAGVVQGWTNVTRGETGAPVPPPGT